MCNLLKCWCHIDRTAAEQWEPIQTYKQECILLTFVRIDIFFILACSFFRSLFLILLGLLCSSIFGYKRLDAIWGNEKSSIYWCMWLCVSMYVSHNFTKVFFMFSSTNGTTRKNRWNNKNIKKTINHGTTTMKNEKEKEKEQSKNRMTHEMVKRI